MASMIIRNLEDDVKARGCRGARPDARQRRSPRSGRHPCPVRPHRAQPATGRGAERSHRTGQWRKARHARPVAVRRVRDRLP